MKRTLKFIITALLIGSFISACEKTDDALVISESNIPENEGHPKAEQYQQIIDDLLEAGVPGLSVTVRSPEGVWCKCGGKADLSNSINLTNSHTLRVGSVTKLITSTTILLLQDEGILSIDDKINKYIPSSITNEIENANNVTIRQLLNHTSGICEYLSLTNYLTILNLSSVKKSAEENLKLIYGKKANFEPGTDGLYTNSNYLLAAMVIKFATEAESANDVIQEKIINKLGLENTYVSTATPSTLSRSYYGIYDNGYMKDVTEIDMNGVGGEDMLDGGIISNSYDLSLFLENLMTGKILSDSSFNQLQDFLAVTQETGIDFLTQYGLGLMYFDTDYGIATGHYGNVYGFNSVVVYYPEDEITLSIIINGYSSGIERAFVSQEVFRHLFE